MEKQEVKSKWDELARQLGAEVAPETEQLVESVSTPAEIVESREQSSPSRASRPAAPKRPAAGWDNLASEFGLPGLEHPATPASVESVGGSVHETVTESTTVERPNRERRQPERRERHPERRERQPKRRGPRESRDEIDADEKTEIAKPKPRDVEVAPPELPREESPKPAPAVSLWHKIFGLPAEQTAKVNEISKDEGSPEASYVIEQTEGFVEVEFSSSRSDPLSVDSAERADVESFEREPAVASDEPASTERRRRPRRRRRGRGGKGDRSLAGDRAEVDHRRQHREHRRTEEADISDSLDLDDDDLESDTVIQRGSSNGENVQADDAEAGTSSRSRAALQRSIPSWDEAIGYIVEVNMQSRSQRRQSSHSTTRQGPSRGRPRGRRKR
jgi:hypothetical protein